MTTSRLALVVLTTGLLCVSNAVGQDEKKAESDADVIAFEEAFAEAKAGDVDAMLFLGVAYAYGVGQSIATARLGYRKSANLGNTKAMCNLSGMYYEGNGVINHG